MRTVPRIVTSPDTGTVAGTTSTPDDLAFAAHTVWQHNGHDVPGALLDVHRRHVSAAIRQAAGEAYDEVLTTPLVWRGFEIDFEQRDRDAL